MHKILLLSSSILIIINFCDARSYGTARTATKYYSMDLFGINVMMKDIKKDDPASYEQLLPIYNKLANKEKKAKKSLLGCIIGGAFFIAAVAFIDADEKYSWLPLPLLGAGVLGLVIPAISYGVKKNKAIDYINFCQEVNKKSEIYTLKIRTTMRYDYKKQHLSGAISLYY
ncbi:MAG: hypothetical protein A2096_03890 [Spirochaetes bacterium GWF1_41_5]|nr:MAG: hypothetical protein A2096_03890 [Spirochaetes bacterium GWF1_41_5]